MKQHLFFPLIIFLALINGCVSSENLTYDQETITTVSQADAETYLAALNTKYIALADEMARAADDFNQFTCEENLAYMDRWKGSINSIEGVDVNGDTSLVYYDGTPEVHMTFGPTNQDTIFVHRFGKIEYLPYCDKGIALLKFSVEVRKSLFYRGTQYDWLNSKWSQTAIVAGKTAGTIIPDQLQTVLFKVENANLLTTDLAERFYIPWTIGQKWRVAIVNFPDQHGSPSDPLEPQGIAGKKLQRKIQKISVKTIRLDKAPDFLPAEYH